MYVLPFKTEKEVRDFMGREFTERLNIPVPEFKFFDDFHKYREYLLTIDNFPILPLANDWPYRLKYNEELTDPNRPWIVIPYAEEIHVIYPKNRLTHTVGVV